MRGAKNMYANIQPSAYLLRPGGNKDAFCANSTKMRNPCYEYATFTKDGTLISGVVVLVPSYEKPQYLCSWKCAERHAKFLQKWGK